MPLSIPRILARADEAIEFSSPEILVRVGQPPKTFHVHEALVRGCSPFFETAMQPRWQGNSRVVVLADDDIDAFNIYMNWLYRGKICFSMPTSSDDSEEIDHAWVGAFHAYALGDKLLDDHFKNALTDAIARSRLHIPSPFALHILYDNTLPASSLRRLVVHAIAQQENHIASVQESWPYALVIDLLKYLQFNKHDLKYSADILANRCEFHEHSETDDDSGCYRHGSPVLGAFARSFFSFTTGTIRFSIGGHDDSTVFSVHDRLLRKCQPSLEFEVKSREAGVWTLAADVDNMSFNKYLNWLCSGKMCIDCPLDSTDNDEIWTNIAETYSFSQVLADTSFADAITDAVALMIEQDRPDSCDYDFLPTDEETLDCMSVTVAGYSKLWQILAHRFACLDNIHDLMGPEWPSMFLCMI